MSESPQQPPPGPPPFLDVDHLIEQSVSRPRVNLFWAILAVFVMMVFLSAFASSRSEQGAAAVSILSSAFMLVLIAGLGVYTAVAAKSVRAEQQQVEAIEELLQLRRWTDAAVLVQGLLSRATRTPQARVQGLVYLATVLARYHRFGDAIHVYEHLLETYTLDPNTTHALRLGRAMSLLREDRLVDADRALVELRRSTGQAASAGLALIEIYRDVKTGHPEEAIEIFSERLPILRQQLGIRVADAYALAARAFDMLNRTEEAAQHWRNATALTPEEELFRRYPELAPLRGKYAPTARPMP